MGGPYFFGIEGWRLVPGHFAERHGLIVLIALGESIVAIGAGAAGHLDFGIVVAAVLGVGIAAGALVDLLRPRRPDLGETAGRSAEQGGVQNALARDSYSYIHLLLVAGIVLTAFGLKTVIAPHRRAPRTTSRPSPCSAASRVYLLGLVAFRLRHVQTLNRHRLGLAILLLALVPVGDPVPALLPRSRRRRPALGDDRDRAARLRRAPRPPARRILGRPRRIRRPTGDRLVGSYRRTTDDGRLRNTPALGNSRTSSTNCSAPAPPRATRDRPPRSGARPPPSPTSRRATGSAPRSPGSAASAPLLAIVGHIDEIGLIVTHVDEKGFLWFTSIGGWDPQILVGQRVEVLTKDGPVPGVAGRKPIHLLEPDQRKKVVELKGMHIDIGAADGDEASALVRVGDPVVIDAEPQPCSATASSRSRWTTGSAPTSRSRACAAAPRATARGGSMAAVAAVQEEIGLFGARTAAFQLRPDVAIAVDVTHATDAPGVDEKELGSSPLGSGPVIGRGSTLSPKVFELLVETAEAEGIEYSISASGRGTSTDADVLQISRAGIPTGLVSIPLRYMHSPVEMCDLSDVEATSTCSPRSARASAPTIDLAASPLTRRLRSACAASRSGAGSPRGAPRGAARRDRLDGRAGRALGRARARTGPARRRS